jgi:hypothetical protein
MNRSDDFIAFSARTNKSKFYAQPDKGVMPPWSMRYVVATMRAQERMPSEVQCTDMFIVQNTSVSEDLTDSDITEQLFAEIIPKLVDVVKLRIVYVPLPQQP